MTGEAGSGGGGGGDEPPLKQGGEAAKEKAADLRPSPKVYPNYPEIAPKAFNPNHLPAVIPAGQTSKDLFHPVSPASGPRGTSFATPETPKTVPSGMNLPEVSKTSMPPAIGNEVKLTPELLKAKQEATAHSIPLRLSQRGVILGDADKATQPHVAKPVAQPPPDTRFLAKKSDQEVQKEAAVRDLAQRGETARKGEAVKLGKSTTPSSATPSVTKGPNSGKVVTPRTPPTPGPKRGR